MENFPVSQQELTNWTTELVRLPSYRGIAGQEAAVAAYIKGVFDREGVECRIEPLRDGRANVLAFIRGTGGGKRLMLNGHTDTVPPYDMAHACDPLCRDGRIYGRGTSDMKGPLASMMGALIALARSGETLHGDLIFAGVADEEAGSIGTIDLIQKGVMADAAVVCEPLGVKNIGVVQKGLEWYEIVFTGRAVHGGNQEAGVNAIEKAVHFISEAEKTLCPALLRRTHPLLGHSTLNFAVIEGGTQPSTVPGTCRLQLDRRFLPSAETYAAVGAELQAILDRLALADPDFHAALCVHPGSVMQKGFAHNGFETDAADPLVSSCAAAIEAATGEKAARIGVPCWTDGGLLSHNAGIPVVVWGPGRIELCHSGGEYIEEADLMTCARGYTALAKIYTA